MSKSLSTKSPGRVALVTGASRGIGRAVALRLAQEGFQLALVARSRDELSDLEGELKSAGHISFAIPVDLRRPFQVERAVNKALDHFGQINVLVNNAGLWHYAPVHKLSLEDWDEMFDVNLRAAFVCTRLVLPSMLSRREGHIVNIGSVSALEPEEEGAGYCATKYGLRGFTEVLSQEVGPKGIRVTLVNPGAVNNGQGRSATAKQLIQVQDVAELVWQAISLPPRASISEVTLRRSAFP